MTEPKKRSPWLYVGIGCGGLVLLVVVIFAVVFVWAASKAKELIADQGNPGARNAKAQALLGANNLPEGYSAVVSLSVPALMEMTILSDEPEGAPHSRDSANKGFIYVRLSRTDSNPQELRDYFEGKTTDSAVLRRHNVEINMHSREVLHRGSFDITGATVLYQTQRGTLSDARGTNDGIQSVMLVQCASSHQTRFAVWFTPDPNPTGPVTAAELKGTPADESAVKAFMAPFNLCQKS